MKRGVYRLIVQADVAGGNPTHDEVMEALMNELDVAIETESGAVVDLTVMSAERAVKGA